MSTGISVLLWNTQTTIQKKISFVILPYQSKKEGFNKKTIQVKSIKRQIKQLLPESVTSQVCYTARKREPCVDIEDNTTSNIRRSGLSAGKYAGKID